MNITRSLRYRAFVLIAAAITTVISSTQLKADTDNCGGQLITLPFTDVPADHPFFCAIAEAFISGLANGTSATTYSPSANVSREQMAAFVTRTLDQSVKRGNKRAALRQFWTTQGEKNLALSTVGPNPVEVASDGTDLWVTCGDSVCRVRGSDGRPLEVRTGMSSAYGVLVAMGKVFFTEPTFPAKLGQIDLSPGGEVATITNDLGVGPYSMAYDGQRIWTANLGFPGSVSIATLSPAVSVSTVTTGFTQPSGILYSGTNIWVTDLDNTLKKLGSGGNILSSIPVGTGPVSPVFDGTNIWVPNQGSNSVSVVRATGPLAGTVLATLTGNGLSTPSHAAFDGERILITNEVGNSVSLWNATDLAPIGTFSTGSGTQPRGACSDGVNFWITFFNSNKIARF